MCSLDVFPNCSQPSATVRNRPCEGRMAVPLVSSAKGVMFGGFNRRVASFRVAGVALRDIQPCFVTCRKSLCVAGAMLLRRFGKMSCSFRGRRSTLDLSIVILCGSLHYTLHTLHLTLHTSHFTLHTLHSTLYTLHTLHLTLHTSHFTVHTLHSTLHTLHSTLYTLLTAHSRLHTSHTTLPNLHFTLRTLHFTLHT